MATKGEEKQDDVDLCAKFAAFCDVNGQFTSKACNKLVKDCFADHFKYKGVILTNRIDSSVFSKCKEKSKQHMLVNNDTCEKFLRHTAYEFAKLKSGDEKMKIDDPKVDEIYPSVVEKVTKATGKKIKPVAQKNTGVTDRLTNTKAYTGSHKERFDAGGKGKGIEGRETRSKNDGYVGEYKNEGTYDSKKK